MTDDLPTKRAPHAPSLKRDLMTIRDAAAMADVDVATIRKWIHDGKNGRKMPTYRAHGDAETVLVSLSLIERWRDKPPRKRPDPAPETAAFTLNRGDTEKLRELEGLMQARLGMKLTHTFCVSSALDHAIRLERARAKPVDN